jgi:hypothetical protein
MPRALAWSKKSGRIGGAYYGVVKGKIAGIPWCQHARKARRKKVATILSTIEQD